MRSEAGLEAEWVERAGRLLGERQQDRQAPHQHSPGGKCKADIELLWFVKPVLSLFHQQVLM